ncbi:MAG: hypothetical protein H6822_31090 [Planctomycetaceae bacterium]|nr:hypothetical protein [Planctomycetales bacterium]MCB9926626.1 hypothetical protein [Planctomycetaceae bacterium]
MGQNRQACLASQKPPSLARGDSVSGGNYFRNLQSSEVALHYERDPKYGRKLKIKKAVRWQWTDEDGRLSFSVNEVKCTTSPSCSIFVHPNADQYKHVWEISLDKLNEFFAKIDDKWIAQYQPIDAEPCPNRCHFVILSLEGTLTQTQLLMVLEALELALPPEGKPSPKGKNPPPGEEEAAVTAASKYEEMVTLHIDPIGAERP